MVTFAKFTTVLAWMALISVSSQIALPPPHADSQLTWFGYVFDKDMHVLLYGVLAIVVIWTLRECGSRRGAIYAIAIAVALAYGLFDEWHQSFVPGRSVSGWDVVFDVVGAGGGVTLWYIWVEWAVNRGITAQTMHVRLQNAAKRI